MKTSIFLSIALFYTFKTFCQPTDKYINKTNPIAGIDFYYNNNDQLEVEVLLKEDKSGDSLSRAKISDIKLNHIEGFIDWSSSTNSKNKKFEIALTSTNDNIYRYDATVMSKNGNSKTYLKNPNAKDIPSEEQWKEVNQVTVSYTLDGRTFNTPNIKIRPSILSYRTTTYQLKLIDDVVFKNNHQAFLKLQLEPKASTAQLTDVVLKLVNGNVINKPLDNSDKILTTSDGVFLLPLNTADDVYNFVEQPYKLSAKAKILDGSNNFAELNDETVSLKKKVDLEVTQINVANQIIKDEDFQINVNSENDFKVAIITAGRGTLGINCTPSNFCTIEKVQRSENNYEFTFKNLNNLQGESNTAYFQFANDGVGFGRMYSFNRNIRAELSNLSIKINTNNSIELNFKLSPWVKDDVKIRLAKKGVTFDAVRDNNGQYSGIFNGQAFQTYKGLVELDSVINENVEIIAKSKTIHEFKLTFVNYKLIQSKLDTLAHEASKKKPNSQLINNTLTDIQKIVVKAGGVLSNSQVGEAVAKLSTKHKRESETKDAMKTLTEIGSWVTTLAPIVLPLLML